MKDTAADLAPHVPAIAEQVDKAIQVIAGQRVGFALVIMPAGRALFSSNCDMKDAADTFEKLIIQWRTNQDPIALANVAASNLNGHDIDVPTSGSVNAATMRVANHYWNLAIDKIIDRLMENYGITKNPRLELYHVKDLLTGMKR